MSLTYNRDLLLNALSIYGDIFSLERPCARIMYQLSVVHSKLGEHNEAESMMTKATNLRLKLAGNEANHHDESIDEYDKLVVFMER
jgi:hypothetical protein